MYVGWRRLSTESAGVGEKRLWLTGLCSVIGYWLLLESLCLQVSDDDYDDDDERPPFVCLLLTGSSIGVGDGGVGTGGHCVYRRVIF